MDNGKTITVTLPGELVDSLDEAVLAGEYPSRDEAVRISVEKLETDKIAERIGVERLGALLRQGAESGPGVDGEEAFQRLMSRYQRMSAGTGE